MPDQKYLHMCIMARVNEGKIRTFKYSLSRKSCLRLKHMRTRKENKFGLELLQAAETGYYPQAEKGAPYEAAL